MLTILIGLPGSGKSTWAELGVAEYFENALWLSSDNLRAQELGDTTDQSNNELIFQKMFDLTVEGLKEGKYVIYDATNISSKRRRVLLEQIRSQVKTEAQALVFAIPFEECVKRNEARERKVPYHVIDRMYKQFEVPTFEEGFDFIDIATCDSIPSKKLGDVLSPLMQIEQDSPYHIYTIGQHCIEAANSLVEEIGINDDTAELIIAALLHDIGKKHCKVFTNKKGEPTEEAHYYGHENVGAYDILTMDLKDLNKVHIAFLVQNHMRMHYLETDKAIAKIKRTMSEETYQELVLLNKADQGAAKNV